MRDIIKHMIPLTTELLISATSHVDTTKTISGLAGDLYSICALNNEGEDYEALPITAEESEDEDDSDMPTLSALQAFGTTRIRSREVSWLVPVHECRQTRRDEHEKVPALVPIRPTNPNTTSNPGDELPALMPLQKLSQPRPPPIERQIYEALDARESTGGKHHQGCRTLWALDNELLDTTYSTQESYDERKRIYVEAIHLKIKPGMGQHTEALARHLTLEDKDALASFTHRHWHELNIEPVHIEFLGTLPHQLYQRA
jgi:hypothetical protein